MQPLHPRTTIPGLRQKLSDLYDLGIVLTKLKVLWLSHFVPYPPKGGCFQRSYNLIKEVARKNEVYLIALRHKNKSNHPQSEVNIASEELEKFCRKVFILSSSSLTGLH